jgi:CelD/BcsL family acetyltransferase involved in cellulose biosynthesis
LDALRAAAADWDGLAVRAGAAQTPAFAEAAWASQTCTGNLAILLAKSRDRLLGVWPLYRENGPIRVLRHLGCGGREEYAGPLLAEGWNPRPILDALSSAARREGDVIELYNLEHDSSLHRYFAAAKAVRRLSTAITCLSMNTASDPWPNWMARKRKSLRNGLARRRRRLLERGSVTFRQVAREEAIDHVRWCVERKRAWLRSRKMDYDWLRSDAPIDFFASLIAGGDRVQGFVLEVDGVPIAGEICLEGQRRLESYLTAYDLAWHAYSPGQLLTQELAEWCSARQLDLDLRFPAASYKLEWADQSRLVHTIVLATTWRGAIAIELQRAQRAIRSSQRSARATLIRLGRLSTSR